MRVKVRLATPGDAQNPIEVESALVDTGAMLTTIPRQIAEQLRLEVLGRDRARTASGIAEVDRSEAYVEIEGRSRELPVWISDTYHSVLIGVTTLELLGFAVDSVSEKLVDSEFLLL